jgi:hypothetical protein
VLGAGVEPTAPVHIVDSLNTIDPFDNIVYHFRQRQKLHEDVACSVTIIGDDCIYCTLAPSFEPRAPHLTCIKCLHMHGIGPCGVSIATFSPSHMNMTL